MSQITTYQTLKTEISKLFQQAQVQKVKHCLTTTD